MSLSESQPINDRTAQATDQQSPGRPLVDMADPGEANSGQFSHLSSSGDSSAFSEPGFVNFDSPYQQNQRGGNDPHWGGDHQGRGGNGRHGGHDHGGSDQSDSSQQSTPSNAGDNAASNPVTDNLPNTAGTSNQSSNGSDAGTPASQSNPAAISQQILTELQQIEQEVQQLQGEMSQVSGGSGNTNGILAPSDSTPSTVATSTPSDTTPATVATSTPSDTTPATVATSTPSDTTPATVATSTPSDTTPATVATSTPSDTTPATVATSAPSDTTPATVATSAPSDSQGTTGDGAIANFNSLTPQQQIAQTDPELNQYLTDAQNQMSAAGYSQFAQQVAQNWSGGQYFDNVGLIEASIQGFQQAGGDASDVSIATSLQSSDITTDQPVYTNLLQMNQGLANAAQDAPAVTSSGQFSTQGDQIIAPDGKPFIPFGTDESSDSQWDTSMSTALANGANTVRLFMPHDPSEMAAFEQNIQEVTSQGDVAIILGNVDPDGHETGQVVSGPDLTAYENMWSQLATQYKNNPNVWFDTLNESGGTNANDPAWLAQEEGMISAIRSTGNDNMIVVDDNNWGTGATNGGGNSSALAANAQALEQAAGNNIIGDVHIYNQGQDEQQDETNITNAIQAIQSQNMPVMIGETGIWPTSNLDGMLAAMQVGEQLGVGVLPLIGGDTSDGTFVPNFITDPSNFPTEDAAVLAYWQNAQAANAAAQSSS